MRLRIKDFTTKVGSGVTPKGGAEVYLTSGIPLFRSQNVTDDGFLLDDIAYISQEIDNMMQGSRVKADDVLLNITGASIGRCYYTPSTFKGGNVNQHVCIIRPKKSSVLPKYLHYGLISPMGKELIKLSQNGANREGLTIENIKNFAFNIPSIKEQEKIITYLDKKVKNINSQITLLTQKQECYLRLKKTLINRTVCHGLNPNAKMKDSGIDWIDKMPIHWNVMAYKRFMKIYNGKDYKHIISNSEEGYPVIGSGGQFEWASTYMYDGEAILFGRKGTIDNPMYINGAFWTVDTMFYSIPISKVCCKYIYYCVKSVPLEKYSTQTALPSMTQAALGNILYAVPPLAEQEAIANYLDDKCSKIDTIVEKISEEINLLGKLKKSLINEVITGKRTV